MTNFLFCVVVLALFAVKITSSFEFVDVFHTTKKCYQICDHGACLYQSCDYPQCPGGACRFIKSTNPTCLGDFYIFPFFFSPINIGSFQLTKVVHVYLKSVGTPRVMEEGLLTR